MPLIFGRENWKLPFFAVCSFPRGWKGPCPQRNRRSNRDPTLFIEFAPCPKYKYYNKNELDHVVKSLIHSLSRTHSIKLTAGAELSDFPIAHDEKEILNWQRLTRSIKPFSELATRYFRPHLTTKHARITLHWETIVNSHLTWEGF